MIKKYLCFLGFAVAILTSCQQSNSTQNHSISNSADSLHAFSMMLDGKQINLYHITNGHINVSVTNFGARLVELVVKDKYHNNLDVILGYDTAEEYVKNTNNFYGAIVGRYGNRIGNASFQLNGNIYTLEKNDNENSLHGGTNGVFNKVWEIENTTSNSITFIYDSPDGEAGYPGRVKMSVTYTLNENNGLEIVYAATTDKETVLNLTNHAYFNLNGAGDETILDHELLIKAKHITEVNEALIPTGQSLSVEGTAFDFTAPKLIGRDVDQVHGQLKYGMGYDHNFELNKKNNFEEVAVLYAPRTGVEMKILTTEPGLQFYSGNFMSSDDPKGKNGKSYPWRSALCLETQHYPDSPNHPNFPSTVLKPGDSYSSKTEYRFAVR